MIDLMHERVMLRPERQRILRHRLLENRRILVSEEAKTLNVSGETIRRDLRALADEGIAEVVFGGAVLKTNVLTSERDLMSMVQRVDVQAAAKRTIAREAARLVRSGDSLIIDSGTTTLQFAQHLSQSDISNLTIITNSLPVAQTCADLPSSTMVVIGGRLVISSLSMIGPLAKRDLEMLSVDWAFMGAAAIDGVAFTSADPYEAEVKRAMICAARRTAVLADATKFGSRRFMTFAKASDVDLLLTTWSDNQHDYARIEQDGTKIVFCDRDKARL